MIQQTGSAAHAARRTIPLPALLFCLFILVSRATQGSTRTWTGGGGADGNWNNPANWNPTGFPGNGDAVVFQGATGLNSTNNLSGLTLAQVRFTSGGFNLYGNPFTLTNSLVATNFSGNSAIYNNFTLATANVLVLTSNGIALTLYGNIAGTVGVTKAGLGTLTYNCAGNNTYTGTTLVRAGTLQLNVSGPNAFGGPLVIGDGTGAGAPTVRDLQFEEIPDGGQVTVNLNGWLDLNDFPETIGGLTMQGGTVSSESNTLTVDGNLTVLPSTGQAMITGNLAFGAGMPTISVAESGGGFDLTLQANVTDNGSGLFFTNSGAGSSFVLLNGSNNVTGPIIANNLNLSPNNSYALGATNPVSIGGSGTLWLSDSGFTNKSLTLQGGATLTSEGPSTWAGPIILNGDVLVHCLNYPADTLNLAGAISGTGNLSVKSDSSNCVLLLSGTAGNTFAGDLYLQTGTLQLAKSAFDGAIPRNLFLGDATHSATNHYLASNQIGNNSTVTLYNGSLLDLNNFQDGIGSLVLYGANVTMGTGFLDLYSPGTIIAATPASTAPTISGRLGLQVNGTVLATNDLGIPAQVYAAGNLIKTGPGNLHLSAANTYSGLTLVQQGFLWAENPQALGATTAGTVVSSGATLVLSGGIGITNEALTLNGPGVSSAWGALDVETGISTWAGPITNNGSSTLDSWESGSELHLNGPITGPGSLELFGYSLGGGTIFYEGTVSNAYAGVTTVDVGGTLTLSKSILYASVAGNAVVSGTLRLANLQQLPTTADVLLNSGGLFDFGTYYQSVDTLRGAGTVNFGSGGWIEVGLNNGSSEFDGNFTGIGYAPGWTVGKTGTGTFTIGGNSTYLDGITHVLAGTLLVNGSQFSIPVQVDAGATLGGAGFVGSIAAYGTIAPGDSGPGILTCSNVTFTSSGEYVANLTGPTPGSGYGQLNPLILGGSNILGNATLQVAPAFTTPVSIGQQFTIVNNATPNLFSGTFNGLPEGAQFSAGGYTFRISYLGGTGNDVVLTLLGIPGNTVTVNAVGQGWYDSTGAHNADNLNYFAGSTPGTTNLYRNFFVFNVPVSTNALVHAELLVNDYGTISPNGQETYLLRKVATPIATLEAGGSGLTGIYNGLGTGSVYAVRSMATNESGQKSIIPLNAQFIRDAAAASGGQLAVGGSVATLNATNTHNQSLFAGSGYAANDVELRLIYGTNVLIPSANRGWYNHLGNHTAGSQNYVVGDDGVNLYRNFFVFNLPAISSQLVDAQLLLNSYTNSSPYGGETYQLYDVTNSITALTNKQTAATNIYADLGTGVGYGGREVYVSESGQVATIPLNANFLAAAQSNSGGRIALGGALTSLNPLPTFEELFGYSGAGGTTDAQLWLGYYTAPISHPAFVGTLPAALGGGQYQFTLAGATGSTNEIQASFDFQRWDYITDVTLTGATGTFSYTNNTTLPYRYFRAEPLP